MTAPFRPQKTTPATALAISLAFIFSVNAYTKFQSISHGKEADDAAEEQSLSPSPAIGKKQEGKN